MPRNTEQFIVDAAALQELGERLIGRPEIALGELVKNSFDADATIARIEFGEDQIVISDNGTGISEQVFLEHWMRLFTTHKIDQRTSVKFLRPLDGFERDRSTFSPVSCPRNDSGKHFFAG